MTYFGTASEFNVWAEKQRLARKKAEEAAAELFEKTRRIYTPNTQLPPRKKVVAWLETAIEDFEKPGRCHHFGICELRALLDYLYGGPPKTEKEELHNNS